jgi:cobalamin biosynthesis protein CobD/CbiB
MSRSGSPRLLVVFSLATLLVVLMVAALATQSWVVLGVALAVHFTATAITLKATFDRSRQGDKADPATEAAREERGPQDERADDDEPRMAI